MEISHRSKDFAGIIDSAEDRLRRLLGVPEDYAVVFLQGGASMQFYMSALNLVGAGDAANYLVTGSWSQKALKEAQRIADASAIWDDSEGVYNRIPQAGDYTVGKQSVYVHYTSNNTIFGTQWPSPPLVGETPLAGDMSSDICCRPIAVEEHDLIYAGAQKNLGPSGVTVVIMSPWVRERSQVIAKARDGGLASMLSYDLMAAKGSLYNTPNTFGIYALERVLAWVEERGGAQAMANRNEVKANLLYTELERTDFWRPHAETGSRSLMNVTWRAPSEELDTAFIASAASEGFVGLKGHRSVGGIRASIYNACSKESVEALVSLMREFQKSHG